MALQQGRDIPVSYKLQAALGTEEPAGAGATKFIYKDGSPGFQMPQHALITSTSNFGDGMTTRGRKGTYEVPGTMNWEGLSGDGHDLLYEMYWRKTHAAAATIDETDLSSATLSVASNVITFSAGDVITAGVSALDVVVFASGLDAADNGKILRVKAVTATSITVHETLTNVAGPVASYSFTRGKKLLQGTQTDRIITIDEYMENIDQSYVIHDIKGNAINFSLTENSTLDINASMLGTAGDPKATGSSPHFTSPTEPTNTNSLAFLDACFAIAGGPTLFVTGFSLSLNTNAQTGKFANKTGKSPDVFQGNGKPGGQWSMAVEDFALLTSAASETQIDFMATFLDPNGTGYRHLAVTNAIQTNGQFGALGNDGPIIQTFDLDIGRDAQGGAFDRTGIKMLSAA